MKRIAALLLVLVIALSFMGCSSIYKNSYDAVRLEKSSGGDSCETEFVSLEGTLILHASVRDRYADGTIHYEATLAEGEISVYYDVNEAGKKELLFTIKGGEKLDTRGGKVARGDKVTFIIETVGTAKYGDIDIDFDF